MEQILINLAAASVMALFGFVIRVIWQSIKDLQNESKSMIEKLNRVEILVVGDYPTREETDRKTDALFEKLDRIEAKLDRKVDK